MPAAASARDVDQRSRRSHSAGVDLFELDIPLLRQLAPDLIITQVALRRLRRERGGRAGRGGRAPSPLRGPVTRGPPRSMRCSIRPCIADALEAALGADGRLLDALTSRPSDAHATSRTETLRARPTPAPRVAVIEWADPLFTRRTLGARDGPAGRRHRRPSPRPGSTHERAARGELADAGPEVLVVAPCGYDLDRAA